MTFELTRNCRNNLLRRHFHCLRNNRITFFIRVQLNVPHYTLLLHNIAESLTASTGKFDHDGPLS